MGYQSGKTTVECPFCHKGRLPAFHRPAHWQGSTSRISSGSKMNYTRKEESYEVSGDCPVCGRKNKDIQAWYNGEYQEKKLSHEERLERMKKAGLPTQIES